MPATFPAFDRVFLCRSGGWSPSWLDPKFNAFVQACPVEEKIDIGLTPRVWDPAQLDEQLRQMREVATMGEKLNGHLVKTA